MKKTARFKLFIGIIAVMAVGAALFVYLDYSMSRISSNNAQLESDNYTVGIDYSGIVANQFVQEGSYVEVGDPLFEIRSSTLAEAIRDNEVAQASLLYSAKPDGTVLVSAAAPGRVQSIAYKKGAFVPANSQIATINTKDGLYVSATYHLSSPDYARLNTNSRVYMTLPDGKHVQATVYDVSLERVDNEVQTTVHARFNNKDINEGTFSAGTPVDTVLELNTDTFLKRIVNRVQSAFMPNSGS